jgi:hypothetical protein
MLLSFLLGCSGEVVHHPDVEEDSGAAGFGVDSLDPDQGPESGGTFVRIVGSGFTTATSVNVGGAPCDELTFLSSGELFCTTPPGAVGATELVASEGDARAALPYTYLPDRADTADTGEAPAEVAGCTLDSPLSITAEEWSWTEDVLASVVVEGRTGVDAEPPGIMGQVGWGPAGEDPSTWVWSDLDYIGPVGEATQYGGGLSLQDAGSFVYGARFRVDHGEWTTCTAASGEWGTLEVTPESVEVPVDYCHLQWPCDITAAAGSTSPEVYAWIYQGGVTQGAGQGEGIQFHVGVGDAGSDPESDRSWTWFAMRYFSDKDGLTAGDLANDEYVGSFDLPATPGTYDYVARATADDGLTWTLCDLGGDSCNLGGSSDGYDDPGVCVAE